MNPLTERQEEILRAAMAIVEEGGVQSLSFRKIAEAIGFSEPAIYRHFVNKDDLLVKMVVFSINLLLKIIDDQTGTDSDAVSIIEVIVEEWLDTLAREFPVTRIFYLPGMFVGDEPVVEEIVRTKVEVEERFREIIERGRLEGSIRSDLSDETLILLTAGPLHFLVHEWALTGKSYDLRQRWRSTWKELKGIIGPCAQEPAAADSEGSRT
jgi:AcrR family transcriptional regulator